MPRLGRRLLPFSAEATPLQAVTYLVGVSLFSISFLVFLNSAVSFVVTDLLGRKHGVGDVVGTLGFVDEVVALVACPLWGLASDRLGVRWVAVLGYAVIALALVAFVQARDVPALVAGRVLFALGASAAATMVTAALPILTGGADGADGSDAGAKRNVASARRGELPDADQDGGADDVDDEETLVGNGYESAEGRGRRGHQTRGSVAVSLESDATITPETFTARQGSSSSASSGEGSRVAAGDGSGSTEDEAARRSSALAGYVGLFTGCGALVALVLFLPLPTRFSHREGVTPADAIAYSFYVVAGVALLVAIFVFLGFAGLPGEDAKGWRMLLGLKRAGGGQGHVTEHRDPGSDGHDGAGTADAPLPYTHLLRTSLRLGLTDPDIALGYLGGFVARASTVAISLFVPLYVNAYYISHGFCRAPPEHDGNPVANDPDFKRECRAAYVLASALTGAAQLVALLCAPAFGYLGGSRRRGRGPAPLSRAASFSSSYAIFDRLRRVNLTVPFAAGVGVVGYALFPRLPSPEFRDEDGRGGSPAVFAVVALLGLSQIGAIVCSLGSLGRGVLAQGDGCPALAGDRDPAAHRHEYGDRDRDSGHNREGGGEADPLIHDRDDAEREAAGRRPRASRVQLKGSIAGVYSLCGGAAILLLTKLGGFLFDAASNGAPFYMMAAFNAVLFVASLTVDLFGRRR